MSECLRCGRDLKDQGALCGWRCARKLGVSTRGALTAAEKTVSEWYDYLEETFAFDMQVREFFQYGSDSGAFDYAIGLVNNYYLAGALSLGTFTVSLLFGDAPPQMLYILEQLEGHTSDEKVTIVFYEKAWREESNWWTEAFHLSGYSQMHSKKHY